MKRLFCAFLICVFVMISGCSLISPADPPTCNDPYFRHSAYDLVLKDQQSLSEFFATTSFKNYFPQTILEGFTFTEGFVITCDVPEHEKVILEYMNADDILLKITLDMSIEPPIADPEKPETYSIAWYREWKKTAPPEAYDPLGRLVPPENYSTLGLFRAEDLSEKVLEGRTHPQINRQGQTTGKQTSISIICGEYRLWYMLYKEWNPGEDQEWIPYNEIYEMMTSSKYFKT